MCTVNKNLGYRCGDDCVQSGCPGHLAEMTYQSTSDYLSYKDGKGSEMFFERGSLNAFMTMFALCGRNRVEIKGELERAYKILKQEEL